MNRREPTIERLAVAEQVLLEPFGLDEAALARALATIGEHRIDDADLYFQSTRHEGWSLEEGRRPLSPTPTSCPKPRCWTPRAPCAASRRPGRTSG